VKPETARFADQARALLARAEVMLRAGLPEDAARTSYLANYHMAQALIYEKTERIMKTHRGVQSEFARITRNGPGVDKTLRGVLSRSYDFKAFADYFTGPITSISADEAADAVAASQRFITHLDSLITISFDNG